MNIPPMASPRIPTAALLTRLAIGGLGIALLISQAHGPQFSPARIELLAPAFFFLALWSGSNALLWIGRGDEWFGPSMAGGLKGMGIFLMIGAFCAILVQPALIYLAGNGFTAMRGVSLDWSAENITIALVGGVLVILARQGRKLKSKLDEFV